VLAFLSFLAFIVKYCWAIICSYKIELFQRKSNKVHHFDPKSENSFKVTEKKTTQDTLAHIEGPDGQDRVPCNNEKGYLKIQISNKMFDDLSTPREAWKDFDNTPRDNEICVSTRRKLTSTEELLGHRSSD